MVRAAQADPATHAEIRQAIEQWLYAFGPAKDRSILERIHHPDFVWTGADGSRMSREEHIAAELGSDLANEIVELGCRRYGDLVVSLGRYRITGTFRSDAVRQPTLDQINRLTGQSDSTEMVFTIVWKLDEGDWRVVAIHLSLIGSAAAAD